MLYETTARLLSAESTDYSFEGREGTTHSIRLNIEGEIYPIKSNEDQVKDVQRLVGKDVDVVVKVNSRKERISLALLKIEEAINV